ncbi:MAG: type IV pilus biogenesis/stability protein PilW [Burkholderiales bacterium]|nr:type IV pilus biogenesis/stability protein PilW [Burkholderiales bacterium]
MEKTGWTKRSWVRWALLGGLVLTVLSAVSGCVNGPGRTGASDRQSDVVTDSDEPEFRKRARLRLELAVNYFEQGQTNVALDEIKQALVSDPSYVEAFNLRGLVYMRMNDIAQAEDSFRRALALNPRSANVQHNYGWLHCQQGRYPQAEEMFEQALSNPTYGDRAKTLMIQGMCQIRAGNRADAERTLSRALELDAGNPITGFNLANLLYLRGDYKRAQFYIRRINNTEQANAESLWLGVKVERRMNDKVAMSQLADQLKRRFPQSREVLAYDRGNFDE